MTSKHLDERFQSEFHEKKRFGDNVVRRARFRLSLAFEIVQTSHENDGRIFVIGLQTQSATEFKAIHGRHFDIQNDKIKMICGQEIADDLSVINAYRS